MVLTISLLSLSSYIVLYKFCHLYSGAFTGLKLLSFSKVQIIFLKNRAFDAKPKNSLHNQDHEIFILYFIL